MQRDYFLSKERRKFIKSLLRIWQILHRREESSKAHLFLVLLLNALGTYICIKILLPFNYAVFNLSPQEPLSFKNIIVLDIFKFNFVILLILLLSFLISFIFSFISLSHNKEIEFLSLTPVHLSDILFAKFYQILCQTTSFVASSAILSFLLYWFEFFKTLQPIMFLNKFIMINIAYPIFTPLILFLLIFIGVGLGFSLSLTVVFILHKVKMRIYLNTPTKWMLIFYSLFLSLALSFITLSSKGINFPKLNFIAMGIADITRPYPHYLSAVKTILILLLIAITILLFIYLVSIHFREFMLLEEPRSKAVKEKAIERKIYLFHNLPKFIEKDLKLFFRGDKSLKWFISDVVQRLIVILIIFIQNHQNLGSIAFFELKFNPLSFNLIIILVIVFSSLFTYSYFSEGKCIYLVKLSPLRTKDLILLKMFGTLFISVPLLFLILIIIFSLFVEATSTWYLILAFLQVFILFEWLLVESSYFTVIFAKYNDSSSLHSKGNFFDTKSGLLLGGIYLATLIVWYFVYKLVCNFPKALSILIFALEVILPILLFNSVLLKKMVSKIENLEL